MVQPLGSLFLLTLTKEADRESRTNYNTLASLGRLDTGISYLNPLLHRRKPLRSPHVLNINSGD